MDLLKRSPPHFSRGFCPGVGFSKSIFAFYLAQKTQKEKKYVNKTFTGLSRDFGRDFVYVFFLPPKGMTKKHINNFLAPTQSRESRKFVYVYACDSNRKIRNATNAGSTRTKFCVFRGRYDHQRTLVIRIAAITLASDSAITMARFAFY